MKNNPEQTTQIAYFDETGDDGLRNSSTDLFVLTSLCVPSSEWQNHFDKIKAFRKMLRDEYGFYVSQEMHTKKFVQNKNPYQVYGWSDEKRTDILRKYTVMIASLNISVINGKLSVVSPIMAAYPIVDILLGLILFHPLQI